MATVPRPGKTRKTTQWRVIKYQRVNDFNRERL